MADRADPMNATPGGGVQPRPGEGGTRLTGDLPAEAAFAAEYPGGDLFSAMLARALERVAASVNVGIAQVWRQHGLSHAAGNALAVIEGSARPMTPGEISAAMHTTSGSITSLIDTLVKRGLVRRMDHAEDRRKVLVEITEAGQALLDAALPSVVLRVRDLQAGLTEAERRQLFALIEKLHESIGTLDLSTVPVGTRHRPDRLTRGD
jgi:DNA-binding MarR family transcriptional regulator